MIKAVNEGIKHSELLHNKESFSEDKLVPGVSSGIICPFQEILRYALNDSRGKVLLRLRGSLDYARDDDILLSP